MRRNRNGLSYDITWPRGKQFAFTVFDDTDLATLENTQPVYSLLEDLGFRTTKSVWPMRGNRKASFDGTTCADANYVAWLHRLQSSGFEIAYHMNTYHTSLREETRDGIEKFRQLFGEYPTTMANHTGCREAIYWGDYRLTGIHQLVYNLLTLGRKRKEYRGHLEGDPHFWGDFCLDKIKYVRNFVFSDINTLKMCPFMPYRDPDRPYVNYWFASSEGKDVDSFNACIAEHRQDRLEEEGGVCIMYTHFASGFLDDGRLESRFVALMKRLSQKNGWFVPAATLLDYLMEKNGCHTITDAERRQLERHWLLHKIWSGAT